MEVIYEPVPEPPITGDTSKIEYRGADLSFLPEIEGNNILFYNGSNTTSVLDIMKSNGCNLVRVRLWHQPANTHSGLEEVLSFCKRIHDKGLKILLDFHYSDTWTDPGNQSIPAAWAGLSNAVLQDSIFAYSKRVIELLKAQNTFPEIVQVGNEINGGLLWDAGKIYNGAAQNWIDFTALLKKAVEGVKSADTDNKIKVMIHYAGTDGADYFYDHIKQQGVNYDMIGLSYYPWWDNKDIAVLQQTLNALTATYQKPVMIAETAYPFTLQWKDNTNNIVGLTNQLVTGYDATPAGQLAFLTKLRNILAAVPNNRGAGFCYWEPDWVAFPGGTVIEGSSWENLALFDFENTALPALGVYHE
ncbi:hypothetical protein BH10BAC2_BH10BAC2_21730 [soil metagenome]